MEFDRYLDSQWRTRHVGRVAGNHHRFDLNQGPLCGRRRPTGWGKGRCQNSHLAGRSSGLHPDCSVQTWMLDCWQKLSGLLRILQRASRHWDDW